MSHNSLSPAFIRINYQSLYGLHSMTIPTVKLGLDAGTYKFVREDLSYVGVAQTLAAAWITAIKAFYPTTTTFIDWLGFSMSSPTAQPIPVTGGAFGVAGTSSVSAYMESKATQRTFTWRTDSFGIFKIVLLDLVVASYEKVTLPADALVASLHAIVANVDPWMRGRDGGKPVVFLQASTTLNEKLRRSYRMN